MLIGTSDMDVDCGWVHNVGVDEGVDDVDIDVDCAGVVDGVGVGVDGAGVGADGGRWRQVLMGAWSWRMGIDGMGCGC